MQQPDNTSTYSVAGRDVLVENDILDRWMTKNFAGMADIDISKYFARDGLSMVRDEIVRYEPSHFTSKMVAFFSMFESCQNMVLSDRISIVGNACLLPWRLNSNLLNDAQFSYSTCIFALLLANRFPKSEDRRKAIYSTNSFTEWFDCNMMACIGVWGFQ